MPRKAEKTAAEVIANTDSFHSPDSSNIAGATFQFDTGKLTIFFHDRLKTIKSVYQYISIPPISVGLWQEFKAAESKGRYFLANIKHLPHTTLTKLTEAEWPKLT